MTYEELIDYLSNNEVNMKWAMLLVVEQQAFNRLLEQAFAGRPLPLDNVAAYSKTVPVSDNETAVFRNVRFAPPLLAVESAIIGAGDAVLRFPLVGGTYQVTGRANGVEYLIEQIQFAAGQEYALELRAPLAALRLEVTEQGRVIWTWPTTYTASTSLGTVPATREKIAEALALRLSQTGAIPTAIHTHTLDLSAQTVFTPRQFGLAVAQSEDDDRYAVNLFATSPQYPQPGFSSPSPPFLLPTTKAEGVGAYDAAVYTAPVLAELLQACDESAATAYRGALLAPLLSILGGAPCMSIEHWALPAANKNLVAFGQPRAAGILPPGVLEPVIAPQWSLRRIGLTIAEEAGPYGALLGTRSVVLKAYGLGQSVEWRLAEGAPGTLTPLSDGAEYLVPEDLSPDYYQVQVTATDADRREVAAMIVLTPPSYTLGITPAVASIDAQKKATLTSDREVFEAYVVNEVGAVTILADTHLLEYSAPVEGGSTQAVVVGKGFKSSGFSVVDLTPPAATKPRWSTVQEFKVQCLQGSVDGSTGSHYANGRQPVEIRITVTTNGVTDANGTVKYYPLTEAELATLHLQVRDGSPVPFLAPGHDWIPDEGDNTLMFATIRHRNRYDFHSGTAVATPAVQQDEGTVNLTLYLLTTPDPATGTVKATEFVAQFTDAIGQRHTSKPETNGMVKITAITPPQGTELVYSLDRHRPAGAEFPLGCGSSLGNEDAFSNCLTSLDYWKLSYKPSSDAEEVRFVECVFETDGELPTPLLSLARWESEVMDERYFSYTGYTFRKKLPAGETDDEHWKTLTYDPWLHWLARLREHPLEATLRPGEEPQPGHLWLALYRVNNFRFWFDKEQEYQADPHELKTFTARFGNVHWDTDNWWSTPRRLHLALVDQFGNSHRVSIGFIQNSRNELEVKKTDVRSKPLAATRLHSNAFNFMSFLETGVDPRTGLYTVVTNLPALKANALAGPEIPVALSYNPLNGQNRGFGLGWDLNLTRFEPDGNRMLSLHTGQQFKVTGSGPRPALEECKLETFHFHEDDSQHWRVVHFNGLVEYLEVMSGTDGRVALPVRLVAPSGHSVSLTYETFRGHPALKAIADDYHELLRVERLSDRVTVRLYPSGQQAAATFELKLDGLEQVSALTLPVPEKAAWAFSYATKNGYRYISEVTTPTGAWERLSYADAGHQFPASAGQPNLPRVTEHVVEPGRGQPAITTRYRYQIQIDGQPRDNNFLGGGQDSIPWADDGLDNLFKADKTYQYGTEQVLLVEEQEVRTVKRVFNAFHLLTLEETTQNRHIQRAETLYNLEEGKDFRDQPANCQLARQATTRWESPAGTRTEHVLTDYDQHGNLLLETAATGVVTEHAYYSADGEAEDCPADPQGFIRQLKHTKVIPDSAGKSGAPVRVQRFFYRTLGSLADSGQPTWLVQAREEKALEGSESTPYQVIENQWYTDNTDALTLGRPLGQTVTFHDLRASTGLRYDHPRPFEAPVSTHTRFEYRLEDSAWLEQSVLKTISTLTGFDGASRAANEEHSVLTGQVLLERDDNDVEVRYRYDALQRLTEEILAPETDDEAHRLYTYGLATGNEPAWQVQEDVQGVQFTTYMDGMGRAIEEFRAEPGAAPRARAGKRPRAAVMQIYSATYDALGQKLTETLYDDCQQSTAQGGWQPLALTTRFEYDDWGQERVQVGPDQVRHVSEHCPIGDGTAPTLREWQEVNEGEPASAMITTVNNLFGDPVQVTREGDDAIHDVTTYAYDGLGRKIEEIHPWGRGQRTTKFELDVYDRDVAQVLPDGARVERQYAVHSDDDLPVEIRVNGTLLGTQTFDGLGRLVATETGGRTRTMSYEGSHTRPREVVTPKHHTIVYEYQPRLGEEPVRRRSNADEIYRYDRLTARLMALEVDAVEVMRRTYFTNGRLNTEARKFDGTDYTMQYQYSVGERLLRYTDVVQQTQCYRYDSAGRLCQSETGTLSPGLLDARALEQPVLTWLTGLTAGQLEQTLQALLSGKSNALRQERFEPELTCVLTYDELSRARSVRTQSHGDEGAAYLETQLTYDSLGREIERRFDVDGTVSTLTQAYDNADCIVERTLREDSQVLRAELFEYDERGHLTWYECSGPECPIDPYGKQIASQLFELDALDNHTYVTTSWAADSTAQLREVHRALRSGAVRTREWRARVDKGTSNFAEYAYEKADPVQLSAIRNDHPDYPAELPLIYDNDGNLTQDDAGRALEYDFLGRLVTVGDHAGAVANTYHYDPSDIISGRVDDQSTEHRFYMDGQLATLVTGERHTAIIRAGDHLIAERDTAETPRDPSRTAARKGQWQ